ncbi:MAG TPA: MBL fold metallo-hydrolase [Beijerinckiaceae bacterium]|jgi:glyoxylase-like metal-dependent hydrolase (beta-lactamase superfamily II)
MLVASRRTVVQGLAAAATLAFAPVARAVDDRLETLSDGAFTLPTGLLSRGASPEEIKKALAEAGLPTDVTRNPLNVSLLTRGDARILFDCGAGQNFMPGAGKLADSLSAASVDPSSVKHVVFTHLHPDHLWGALDDFDAPAFPEATYHVAAAERDYWLSPKVYETLPEDRHAFAAGAQRILKALEPSLRVFKPGDEVAPGVMAIDTRGHTPGHVSFDVKVGSETITVLGDALTHPVFSFRHPDWAGGFDQEPERAVATRKALLDKTAAERGRIVGYHLPQGGMGRVERAGAAYRFVAGA